MTTAPTRARPLHAIRTVILAALASSRAAISVAGDADDLPRTVVRFGDLDLSSPAGAATLYHRIVDAASEVCKTFYIDIHGLELPAEQIACVRGTVRNAVVKVGQPALEAIYNTRNRQPLSITLAVARER